MPTTSERDRDVVGIEINGKSWQEWNDLEIHLSLDTHPSAGFGAPWDPTRADMRANFVPCGFVPMAITVGGQPLFAGKLVDVTPRVEASRRVVDCNAYSLAAELETTNLPADRQPFEASGLTLRQVAERLAGIYGIGVSMAVPDGAPFRKVNTKRYRSNVDTKVDQETKIDEFIVELARQRAYVRTSDAQGKLLIWQSVQPGNPVARLREGQPPVISVVPTFSPQDYYSEITGFTTAKRGVTGSAYTQRNNRLSRTVLRALSFRIDDVEKGDAPRAVAAKYGRMLANACSYVVQLPGWRDAAGNLYQPNTTITLEAPGAMVYGDYEFIVRDVYLKENEKERTCSLGLVVPGAFSAEIPARMPWEEP